MLPVFWVVVEGGTDAVDDGDDGSTVVVNMFACCVNGNLVVGYEF